MTGGVPALWNAVAWAARAAYPAITSILIFRALGERALGIWATLWALRGFVVFVDSGLGMSLARDAAHRSDGTSAFPPRVAAASWLYFAFAFLTLVGGLAAAGLTHSLLRLGAGEAETARGVTIAFAVETALILATGVPFGVMRGRSRFDLLAAWSGLHALVASAAVAAVLFGTSGGLVGAAWASAGARVLPLVGGMVWLRGEGVLRAPSRPALREVTRFSLPLWVAALGTQLAVSTDVPIVSITHGAAAAGHYAVGAAVPAVGASLLFALTSASFPRLAAAAREHGEALVRSLVFFASLLGAAGFAFIALSARSILEVWFGTAAPLAVVVAVIYSFVWLCNVPAHVLSLLATARGVHAVVAPLVWAEALLNVALSVSLAVWVAAWGPAAGTLVSLALSNLVVVPWILLRRLNLPARSFVASALRGFGLGGVAALTSWAASAAWPVGPAARLAIGIPVLLASVGLVMDYSLRMRAPTRRLLALIVDGGWRTRLRQRREIGQAREALARDRALLPALWMRSTPPLVTVRIATYSRGRLIAERAIASALAQTHPRLEVLVVGDCCDEATAAAVRSVKDDRVRFENLPERGRYPPEPYRRWMVAGCAPMNRALELARGDWIAPLDDDDEFTPDHVEVLLDACRTRRLEFAYGIADTEVSPDEWKPIGAWPLRIGGIVHSAAMYWSALRIFDHAMDSWRLHEPADWNMWRRMRAAGVAMGFVDRVVCRHYLERREVRGTPSTPSPEKTECQNSGS
ncbi:MAG TPA: glycosyltransferase [Vicinamibacteria bacterium]|nr:glycosyltransferase [Vicinamibacteria bacterium]